MRVFGDGQRGGDLGRARTVGVGAVVGGDCAFVVEVLRVRRRWRGGSVRRADQNLRDCARAAGSWDLTGIGPPPGIARPHNDYAPAATWEAFDEELDRATAFSLDLPIDRELGRIPETLRLTRSPARTGHPLFSYLAVGPAADRAPGRSTPRLATRPDRRTRTAGRRRTPARRRPHRQHHDPPGRATPRPLLLLPLREDGRPRLVRVPQRPRRQRRVQRDRAHPQIRHPGNHHRLLPSARDPCHRRDRLCPTNDPRQRRGSPLQGPDLPLRGRLPPTRSEGVEVAFGVQAVLPLLVEDDEEAVADRVALRRRVAGLGRPARSLRRAVRR